MLPAAHLEQQAAAVAAAQGQGGDAMAQDDMAVTPGEIPQFPALSAQEMAGGENEYRRIRVPPHRLTPLRQQWNHVMQPVVEHLQLQIRFNPKLRSVELKTSEHTRDSGAIQKGADFIQVTRRRNDQNQRAPDQPPSTHAPQTALVESP